MPTHRWFVAGAVALVAVGLAGCTQRSADQNENAANGPDQSRLCQVDTWKPVTVANQCQPGQKVLYRPSDPNKEKQAALFAAANCDLRYSVVSTGNGTTCIYKPISSANSLSSGDADSSNG